MLSEQLLTVVEKWPIGNFNLLKLDSEFTPMAITIKFCSYNTVQHFI